MKELQLNDVIENTKQLLGSVRQSLVKVAANLHFLRKTGEHEKFGEWAEEEFGLSRSMTSKLLSLYEGWVIKAGIPQEHIEGIDYEKLYGYLPLLGKPDEKGRIKSPEEMLADVKTWSRKDIKDEKNLVAPCFHPNIQRCCTECWSVIPE